MPRSLGRRGDRRPTLPGQAARGESPAAFDGRCIPALGVARRLNIPDIRPPRAWIAGRLARLGATRHFYHRLLVLGCLLAVTANVRAQGADLPPALAGRFAAGVTALQGGSLGEAEAAFRAVLREGGDRAFVHHNLGIVLQQRGQHTAAIAEFHRASALDPAFGPARLLAGSSLIALGRSADALVDLEHAVRLMPREIAAHLQLADACERTGRIACLTEAYRDVVALAPDDPEYAYRLGKAYLRLSQHAYERIRAIDPQAARLSQALGREYLAQGQPQLARVSFEAAAARDPRLADVHLALAQLAADDGRWDDAAREVAFELAVQPTSREALALRAHIDAARSAGRP
jgi:Tfp pilus assembly protein PilF